MSYSFYTHSTAIKDMESNKGELELLPQIRTRNRNISNIDPVNMLSSIDTGSFEQGVGSNPGPWASNLLLDCAKAIMEKEMGKIQQLLWMLNELASPYGDCEQRVAAYFLQALFCKMMETGPRCHKTLCAAVERSCCFDSMRKMILKFQEASPWTTFGHVAANSAILEAFDGENCLHIVDMSTTLCTQWPMLLESLATRNDGTPTLRLTTVILRGMSNCNSVMKEIGQRMEKFARLMGVPFEFSVVYKEEDEELDLKRIELRPDEVLAVNCVYSLQRLKHKDSLLSALRNMNPKIVTVVEEEVDLESGDFYERFCECHRFFSLYFVSLEESFGRTSNERLMLEREMGRSLVNILACPDNCEHREKSAQWAVRFDGAGFEPWPFSDDAVDDVRALLKRYKEGWGLNTVNSQGLFLTWKEQSAVWVSAWKPK
ncbi:hypothetical protein SUGI_0647020 [Cryptomeria japonica]|uniref:protein SHORT-ROOT n=1 Tax=Cryptomeria japonica TaxID=3369 RepID=UPI00241477D4|nr:protein SHORT-ROOT [Cryptomeria japonica]GLJ32130.1 hypothetical protein SUGI_0647020 [Cryptomeria japonica]